MNREKIKEALILSEALIPFQCVCARGAIREALAELEAEEKRDAMNRESVIDSWAKAEGFEQFRIDHYAVFRNLEKWLQKNMPKNYNPESNDISALSEHIYSIFEKESTKESVIRRISETLNIFAESYRTALQIIIKEKSSCKGCARPKVGRDCVCSTCARNWNDNYIPESTGKDGK